MRALLPIVAGLLVAASPGLSGAGAWLQPPGAIYAKMSGLLSETSRRFDCDGAEQAAEPFGGTYRERKLFWYGEYGWRERVTLVGSFAAGQQDITDAAVPDYGTRSTGDLRVGARTGLHLDPARPVSLEAAVSIPTYPRTDPTLPVGERRQFLPAGTGYVQAELRLQSGVSLWPLPLYGNLDGGYRVRGGPFGDELLLAAEIGGSAPRFFAKLEFRGIWPASGRCREGQTSAGSVSIEERSLRLGPEAAFRVAGDWWVGLTWTTLLEGRNTLDNDQWLFSVAWTRPGREG